LAACLAVSPAGHAAVILQTVLRLAVVLFPLSEIALALVKRESPTAKADDRGSMQLLWLVIGPSVVVAVAVSGYRATSLPFTATVQELTATGLLVGGLVLRWTAIITLGRFFTAKIAIHQGQPVMTSGPYRYVRHPSYAGLLLAFIGLGVFFGNWLSVIVLFVPITFAVVHRIRLEESVLAGALGPAYCAYCARTKRLIPGIW
jgi:protein-S-isoprenylcysteine O-methyltransferase Ste14